ncbi:hypothetical protein CHLRE_06g280350v5 [Chlamydomonas reinhardtii]|uniref:Flagellar associated protein n=1 Tax=Chlamydomonas reinhardtii TaxID=3055 RepID=A0A2K3DPK4_CHLRE|nr:uncharacterized protein CHLRE_06g280350v5 [Chlamydomonas reinhardtii]PNW82472.1 hypothetical protein CHLRE_06g280350v5 [Chlamydomonas reinhardtii]
MYSDDEEAEIAVDIKRLWDVKIPLLSQGQKEPLKAVISAAKNKDPSVVCTHYDVDRRRFFYGMDNGAVCFWPLDQSRPNTSRFVGAHKGPVSAICTPRKGDGQLGKAGLIVTGSVDSSIKIWDYQGKVILDPTVCVQTLYGHSGTVTALVILGDYIVSSSTDGSIKMWRQEEGRGQLVYPWFELQATVAGMEGWVRCMAYDSSGAVGDLGAVFAADESGGVTKVLPEAVWDDSIQRLSTRMDFKIDQRVERLHDRGISVIRYVAKWDMVLTVAYDQCLRAYDVKSSQVRHAWVNERGCQFTTLEINIEFDEVLAGDTSGVLSIFSVRTGRLMVTKQLVAPPGGAAASRRGVNAHASAASGSGTGSGPSGILSVTAVLGRQLYAVTTARELSLWLIEHELEYNVARGGHDKALISLYSCSGGVAGPGGDHDYRIFSASIDNTVRLWDPYDMACIRVMEELSSEISAMTFYEGWNLLVTGHDNGDIRLWNLDTGSTTTLRQHTNTVTSLELALVHRNEELLISGSYDGWVVLWDIRSLRGEEPHMVAKFRAHGPDTSNGLASGSSNGRGAAEAAAAGGSSGVQTPEPAGHTGGAAASTSLSRSEAAKAAGVAMGLGPSAVAALQGALGGPDTEILALKFDPLKKVIVTAGTDRVIKVWAATGYEYLGCHTGHTDAVGCLALDSNFLFSGSDDCNICLWDTVPASSARASTYAGLRTGASPGPALAHSTSLLSGQAAAAAVGSVGASSSGGAPPAFQLTFSGRPLKTLKGHTRNVTGLDVLPSSGNLVSCSLDGQLLVWDYVSGTVLHRFTHEMEEFRCLALRYDRPEVLVGTVQASLLRYTIHEAAVAVPAKTRLARGAGRPVAAEPGLPEDLGRLALEEQQGSGSDG